MVTTSSILHEAMVADRQREMRDKAAHHRCLLDAESAEARPGLVKRIGSALSIVLAQILAMGDEFRAGGSSECNGDRVMPLQPHAEAGD